MLIGQEFYPGSMKPRDLASDIVILNDNYKNSSFGGIPTTLKC